MNQVKQHSLYCAVVQKAIFLFPSTIANVCIVHGHGQQLEHFSLVTSYTLLAVEILNMFLYLNTSTHFISNMGNKL